MNRETEVDHTITNMANCLMLLSGRGQLSDDSHRHRRRVFECKTCSRQFGSFQALGGHRASHKKLRFAGGAGRGGEVVDEEEEDHGGKPKTHECSVCGLEFSIGQALGGHMRRHRSSRGANNNNLNDGGSSLEYYSKAYDDNDDGDDDDDDSKNNKSNKRKRVLFLDLNLTPFENDLVFLKIGKPTTFEISLGV